MRWLLGLAVLVSLAGCGKVSEVSPRIRVEPSTVTATASKAQPPPADVGPKRKVARRVKLPRDNFPVSQADLVWGRSQVDLMMRNRPGMGLLVKSGDVI